MLKVRKPHSFFQFKHDCVFLTHVHARLPLLGDGHSKNIGCSKLLRIRLNHNFLHRTKKNVLPMKLDGARVCFLYY